MLFFILFWLAVMFLLAYLFCNLMRVRYEADAWRRTAIDMAQLNKDLAAELHVLKSPLSRLAKP